MLLAILIVVVILIILCAVAFFVYWQWRRNVQDAKNYERGIKMVPMLIHLPPSSDDIDSGGKDERDVAEQSISRAQSLYGVLASTFEKGRKQKLHGQKHITFEIIASHGMIYYYVVAPVSMLAIVEQAILSAYPTARLEEVAEHNIFSREGRIDGVRGGELELKEHFANPIATFQETKRENMRSILNALSSINDGDGAGIQILIRPASPDWSKNAINVAKDKKDKKSKGGIKGVAGALGTYAKEVPGALTKVPGADEKGGAKPDDKSLSNLEQSHIEAIEEKTRHVGFETKIRLIASSTTGQQADIIVKNLFAAFSLFESPGKNGFKYVPAKNVNDFVTNFILRMFPQRHVDSVFNAVELATLFHLPDDNSTPTSQLDRQNSKQVEAPTNIPTEGLLLGYNDFRGMKKDIFLSDKDRRRHLYMVGQTGTGKSVLMENLAVQDMLAGRGFAYIDPHGDSAEAILNRVPEHRAEDVVYFSPGEMEYPLGLNLFEWKHEEQKDFLIQEAINMLEKLYDPNNQGIIGPRYHHIFRNSALLLMADPEGSSMIDITKLFRDQNYVHQKLKHVTDETVREFWLKEMPASQRSNDFGEVKSWFVSKFGAFLSNEMMRNIIGQTRSSFDLRTIMDEQKILLVNLSKGRTGDLNSRLLGMIFVMQFQSAAMSRVDIPEEQRKDFSLYVDEFQNFSTDSFATILSEARKFRLNLIVANQFISQLDENVRDAVFGNVGSMVSLRTGANDADFLVKQFSPAFSQEDMVKMPNYQGVARVMMNNVPSDPFSLSTNAPIGVENTALGDAIKQLSNAKYGKPRKIVEKEILDRLRSDEPVAPAGGARPGAPTSVGQRPAVGASSGPATATPQSRTRASGKPGSFLDDWMARKKASAPAAAAASPLQPRPMHPPAPVAAPKPFEPSRPTPHQNISEPALGIESDGQQSSRSRRHSDDHDNPFTGRDSGSFRKPEFGSSDGDFKRAQIDSSAQKPILHTTDSVSEFKKPAIKQQQPVAIKEASHAEAIAPQDRPVVKRAPSELQGVDGTGVSYDVKQDGPAEATAEDQLSLENNLSQLSALSAEADVQAPGLTQVQPELAELDPNRISEIDDRGVLHYDGEDEDSAA